MTQPATQSDITISLSADSMLAQLTLCASATVQSISLEACLSKLHESGIAVTAQTKQSLKELVEQFATGVQEDLTLTIQGTPPKHGTNGRIEWMPGLDPTAVAARSETDRVDFYNQTRFITLKSGQRIARIFPPQSGEAGFDVCGRAVTPKSGLPVPIKLDANSILLAADGWCTAQIDGVLHFDGRQISVNPILNVEQFVDFSTGNIEYTGSVIIHKGVRDRFRVKVDGDVEAGDLIEAATIIAGRDLKARGGVAAKESGSITVGRDLFAKYLDCTLATIKRNADIEREVIQCTLVVGGTLNVGNGTIIGGNTTVAGPAKIKNLGSIAHLATILTLGCSPAIQGMLQSIDRHVDDLNHAQDAARRELRAIQMLSSPTAAERERTTELLCKPVEIQAKLDQLMLRRKRLDQYYQTTRKVDLTVYDTIHEGTQIIVDDLRFIFTRNVRGPIWIGWTPARKVACRIGSNQPLHPVNDLPGVLLRQADRVDYTSWARLNPADTP